MRRLVDCSPVTMDSFTYCDRSGEDRYWRRVAKNATIAVELDKRERITFLRVNHVLRV